MDVGYFLLKLNHLALYFFLTSVPLTYVFSYVFNVSSSLHIRQLLFHGLRGGIRHAVFQFLAWTFWLTSIWLAVPLVANTWQLNFVDHEALPGVAAVLAVFAQLFLAKAVVVYNAHVAREAMRGLSTKDSDHLERVPHTACTAVVMLGFGWVALGLGLIIASEYLPDTQARLLYYLFAMASLIVGALTTHGLGGNLRYGSTARTDASSEDGAGGWQFFQPFHGGTAFVATQAAGWAFFALCLTFFASMIVQVALGIAYCLRCWMLATGTAMFFTQGLLGASLFTFKGGPAATSALVRRCVGAPSSVKYSFMHQLDRVWLPVVVMFTPVHLYVTAVALSCMLVSVPIAFAGFAGLHMLRFVLSAPHHPEHTGCLESPSVRGWFTPRLEESLRAWLGLFEVIKDEGAHFDPKRKYVFGYHPHGLYPLGAAYLPMCPSFHRLLPGMSPITLTANAVFFHPVLRDVATWLGMRQVTRPTFKRALEDRGSVIVVPGGQAELVHTWRLKRNEWVMHTKHYGFVKIALESGASLVPIVAFGEADSLRNLVDVPAMQAWTYKRVGFPVPYLMVGRWVISPFPARTGLRFVIGQPLAPPPVPADGNVTQELVQQYHKQYYSAVQQLFEKHKGTFPGYEAMECIPVVD